MADPNDLRREWLDLSPAWIREAREGRNPTRAGLLDRPMLEACGDVAGLQVLDCGCGEGRFCRLLLARGACGVLGLDLCPPMIAAARELQTERDDYRIADVQDLGFLADASFDLVVSYLNQCDLPHFEANTREVFRVLKGGGRFVVANLHPMRTAAGGWFKAPDGTKQHVILDNYFAEGERHWKMMGVDFTNFHRTLTTYVRAFSDVGFFLEVILEPTVPEDLLPQYPELEDERRVPNFILYRLHKP